MLGQEKRNFGSGQLNFENCPVAGLTFFLLLFEPQHKYFIFQQGFKLEIQIKPVLILVSCRKGRLKCT